LDGYIFSQGSNILVETSILKEVHFDEKFLAEDMRWSLEIMDRKMVTIHYCPSMISYGQTPTPFNNIYKRRRRWNKGRYQCKLYTVFNISPFKLPSYIDYLFQAIIEPFIIIPILWYLWVFGFWVLHSEFKNQWFFYINVNHPIIWICYPLFILMVFGNLVYCIQTLLHVSETDWLNNGRSSRIKDFGRIVYGIWSDWIGFFPIVTYNFWLIKYHESEMFIEWMLSMSNQWDPTPKVSKTKSVDDEFF
jgi:cellulose synthase/poly-beta-1,6-N-acetylglucosamine synthase-like glycosyltransferase